MDQDQMPLQAEMFICTQCERKDRDGLFMDEEKPGPESQERVLIKCRTCLISSGLGLMMLMAPSLPKTSPNQAGFHSKKEIEEMIVRAVKGVVIRELPVVIADEMEYAIHASDDFWARTHPSSAELLVHINVDVSEYDDCGGSHILRMDKSFRVPLYIIHGGLTEKVFPAVPGEAGKSL
ncbi:MAG: hypothetical protein HY548_00015 [Elusimicrobia bacterium]|nr:hypothetical protein [Elusimicrobiota bacterium]